MKAKKRLIAVIAAALVCAVAIGTAAYSIRRFQSADKPAERRYVDRLDLSLSRTAFTFDAPKEGELLVCETTLTIAKSEAEFYGKLIAVTVEGGKNVIFTADRDNGGAVLPQDLLLPATGDGPVPLSWTISFGVPYEAGKTDYEASVVVTYETGLNADSTDVRQAVFPVSLTAETAL